MPLKTTSSIQNFYSRIATLFVVLAVAIVALVAVGIHAPPRIIDLNITQKVNPSQQRQLLINFNHPMDRRSVETNFSLDPAMKGTFSWSGRTLAFTPEEILPYGKDFHLKINKEAFDENSVPLAQDFNFQFTTNPLQFAYIGVEGEETGRLVVSSIDGSNRQVVTEKKLSIEDFHIAADGKSIYILGSNELYVYDLQKKHLTQLTNDKNFLNKAFQLSPDGGKVLVFRVQVNTAGVYLTGVQGWISDLPEVHLKKLLDGSALALNSYFSPDGSYLLYRDSTFQLLELNKNKVDTSLFLGDFDLSYGFHPSQPILLFNKYDYSDVFSMNNFLTLFYGDGHQQKVDFGQGLSRDTVFTPDGKSLIAIFSKPEEAFEDRESLYPLRIFHLYLYDIATQKTEQLTSNFDYSEEGPTVSPDSKHLLFERYETFSKDIVIDPAFRDVTDSLSSILSGGKVWRMDLATHDLQELPMKGNKVTFFP